MTNPLVRQIVEQIKDYVPGKNPPAPGVVKLASNENPFGPSPQALEAIAKEGKNLHVYPDQKAIFLREALAKKFNLPIDCFICGNGSDDIMQIIGSTYLNPGDEVIVPKNTFSLYELVARIFDGRLVFADLDNYQISLKNVAAVITPKTKIVFLTNPNNPTGTIFTAADFSAFMKQVPENVLVVVDEAYAEFVAAPDFPNCFDHIRQGENVIVLRTFSKFYGLAGLRIGYGVGKKELIAPMFRTKMPFNVSRLAQVGAIAALGDQSFLDKTFQNNLEGKWYLYTELDKLGLEYKKTESNFIFVNVKRSADELFLSLMKAGVIIRPLTSFGFPQAIRVSIGTPEQNRKFIVALS